MYTVHIFMCEYVCVIMYVCVCVYVCLTKIRKDIRQRSDNLAFLTLYGYFGLPAPPELLPKYKLNVNLNYLSK